MSAITLWIEEDRGHTTPCWVWQRTKTSAGYANPVINGKVTYGHRYFYELVKGPIPEGLVIDHLCRMPSCVNPDHLEAVTNAENVRRGDRAKLTAEQAREIRAAIGSYPEIGKRYGISAAYVGYIKRGLRWADVGGPVVTSSTHCKRGHRRVEGESECLACRPIRFQEKYENKTGRKITEEHRANLSAAAKARWAREKAAA